MFFKHVLKGWGYFFSSSYFSKGFFNSLTFSSHFILINMPVVDLEHIPRNAGREAETHPG